jgi:multidrug efflux system membrane fusion protein
MSGQTPPDLTGKLNFDGDKGAGRSKWVAMLLVLLLVGWMGSGYLNQAPEATAEDAATAPEQEAISVAVLPSVAQDVQLVVSAEGQSEPDRISRIPTEAAGRVVSVSAARGDFVEAGQELGRVDATTIEAQVTQARTQLDQATRDLDNALELQARGIATEDRVAQARAGKAAAEAALTAAEEMLGNTIIRAPFAGRLNDLMLDVGEFVDSGVVVAELLDSDPLSVVVQVPQQALSRIAVGQDAQVVFITGEERLGRVSFIGGNADQQTRTFRVEVTVDNPQSEMPAGLSARVILPTGTARGHFISPAILSLGTSGELGIKTVDEDNRVAFSLVSIVRAETDGIWVTGLPESADIITVGQGFVRAGDLVAPQVEDAALKAELDG